MLQQSPSRIDRIASPNFGHSNQGSRSSWLERHARAVACAQNWLAASRCCSPACLPPPSDCPPMRRAWTFSALALPHTAISLALPRRESLLIEHVARRQCLPTAQRKADSIRREDDWNLLCLHALLSSKLRGPYAACARSFALAAPPTSYIPRRMEHTARPIRHDRALVPVRPLRARCLSLLSRTLCAPLLPDKRSWLLCYVLRSLYASASIA